MKGRIRRSVIMLIITGILLLCAIFFGGCCKEKTDLSYIEQFDAFYSTRDYSPVTPNSLDLFVDYSCCVVWARQNSAFYKKIESTLTRNAKRYYSIKGSAITEESGDTYKLLCGIDEKESIAADLKTAVERMAQGDNEAILITDGEYYQADASALNSRNPYLASAFETWLKKGRDIYILSEDYPETNSKGVTFDKKLYYIIFTDHNLGDKSIYQKVTRLAKSEMAGVEIFCLSFAPQAFSFPMVNDNLNVEREFFGLFESQDWLSSWSQIKRDIVEVVDDQTGEKLANGSMLMGRLYFDKNASGAYRVGGVRMSVFDITEAYTDFYNQMIDSGVYKGERKKLPCVDGFLLLDKQEFNKHSKIDIYFDKPNIHDGIVSQHGCYNYFKIELYVDPASIIDTLYKRKKDMLRFESISKKGEYNESLYESVEQCVYHMKQYFIQSQSPFYSVYIKCPKK